MRSFLPVLFTILTISLIGCGDNTTPQTVETSEIENYVNENADAVARQEELDQMAEAEAEDEDE